MLVFLVFITPALLFEKFLINLTSHLFFIHNLHIDLHGSINGSNWSLATEMQFYLLIVLTGAWLKEASIYKIIFAFLGIAWLWKYIVVITIPYSSETGPFPIFIAATQLPGVLDEFLVGILIARLAQSKRAIDILLTSIRLRILLLITTILFLGLAFFLYWEHATYWNYNSMVVFFRTLLAFGLGLLIIFLITIKINTHLRHILSPFFYLGTISYGIYLWHLPVLLSLREISWLSPMQALIYTILLTCIFASISWHFFEKPILNKYKTN